ncbi:MAG TPA: hypothetical protein VNC50_09645, partial [Planctomycetia bacterium]|nr:hypothetical protein [Planctomycetia bacterium]
MLALLMAGSLMVADDAQDADAYAALLTLKDDETLRRIRPGVEGRLSFLKRLEPDANPAVLK